MVLVGLQANSLCLSLYWFTGWFRLNETMRINLRSFVAACFIGLLLLGLAPGQALVKATDNEQLQAQALLPTLSPFWRPTIQQWAEPIGVVAADIGLDPDFIAAVIREESNGVPDGISRLGAVGLMGVMPQGPGLEWRPPEAELLDPEVNLRWGVAILTEVIRQSGGDIHAALAAYSGGWSVAGRGVPQAYADSVLDHYARAVLIRQGLSTEMAAQWTIAVEIPRGNIPSDPVLLGNEPLASFQLYAKHVIFSDVDELGRSYNLIGYVVPVAVTRPPGESERAGTYAIADPQILVRQGVMELNKGDTGSPRLVLACLPSLDRLRGRLETRWYAPSACPDWHR